MIVWSKCNNCNHEFFAEEKSPQCDWCGKTKVTFLEEKEKVNARMLDLLVAMMDNLQFPKDILKKN